MSSSSSKSMQAWTYFTYGGELSELAVRTVKFPSLTSPFDIIVKNHAISLNPTDDQLRSGSYGHKGRAEESDGVIGGRDASGVVVEVGSSVSGLKVADAVFYCPVNTRPGTFAQYTAVDSRLVALKPNSLTHQQAAALPLTTLTIYQSLKEKGQPVSGQSILITAGAGGAGSAAIQLSKAWGLHVTATASRAESKEWCKQMGADQVIDHSQPLAPQLSNLSIQTFDYVYDCFPDALFDQLVQLVKPRGHMFFLLPFSKDHTATLRTVFMKSVSLHFEMMFARAMYKFEEEKVGQVLREVAKLVDSGQIKSTANKVFEWTQLDQAFHLLVSSRTIGKSVVSVQQ